MTTGFLRTTGALGLSIALAACGGGGHHAGGAQEFHVLSLHRDIAGDTVTSMSARYTDHGGGTLGTGEGYASDGSGLAPQPDLPFAVDGARTLTATPSGSAALLGRMSEDGVFGAASTDGASGAPELLLVVRRDPAPTAQELVGEWFQLTWVRRPGAVSGSESYCAFVEAQISTSLTLTETAPPTYNDDGVVNGGPPPVSFPQTVNVLSGGWIEIDRAGLGSPMRGGLSIDGNVLLLGATGSGLLGVPGDAEIWVLVRRGLAIDTAEAMGSVRLTGFLASGSAFASIAGTGSFLGPTGGTATMTGNIDGSVTPPAVRDFGESVLVSGKASVSLGGLTLRGASGPTGNYLATIGGLTNGDGPGIFIFVR